MAIMAHIIRGIHTSQHLGGIVVRTLSKAPPNQLEQAVEFLETQTAGKVCDQQPIKSAPKAPKGPTDTLLLTTVKEPEERRLAEQITRKFKYVQAWFVPSQSKTTISPLVHQKPLSLTEPLSRREQDVWGLMAAGKTNPQIAQLLTITAGTTKTHVRQVLGKLGVNTRQEAACLYRNDQLPSEPFESKHSTAGPYGKPLTPAERKVAEQLIKGHDNKSIAQQLWISIGTVKTHVHRIFAKTGANNRIKAATVLSKEGMITSNP
jgi:DNA-binding NarL/FixJ family response regulator